MTATISGAPLAATGPAPHTGTVRTSGLRPRSEGANIRTWIGFKHFLYLAEEAVLGWFRAQGLGPAQLFGEYGLGLTIVDTSVLLPHVLDVDDVVVGEVTPEAVPGRFAVRLKLPAGDGPDDLPGPDPVVLRGKMTVALVARSDAPVPPRMPDALAGFTPPAANATPSTASDGPDPAAFRWDWRVPYFYCQFSDRLAFDGYVRAMEEVVDRFLADRGISVRRMLDERGWIPVVSRARLSVLAEVEMEESVTTTLVITDVIKDMMYAARMDCYVQRSSGWVHTATGQILHGYANSRGPDAGALATLDATTIAALTGVSA